VPIANWCYLDKKSEAALPIDDQTQPCDDEVVGEKVRSIDLGSRDADTYHYVTWDGKNDSGNKVASGTEILKELGPEHLATGSPILYTSGDSVFQVAAHGDIPGAFISNAVAVPLRNLSPDLLQVAFTFLWWAHIALVAAFLCYLPFSKHLHIATAFPNIFFRKLEPRGELPKLDLEDENATFGLKTLQDLGWKDLLDGFTCTECGRCQEACPAYNTGKPLNPKELIMGIRHMSVDAEHGIDIIPNSPIVRDTYGLEDTVVSATALAKPIVDDAIPYDAVWDCVTCGACVEACPVLIEHVDKIVGLRRNLVLEESRFPTELTAAFVVGCDGRLRARIAGGMSLFGVSIPVRGAPLCPHGPWAREERSRPVSSAAAAHDTASSVRERARFCSGTRLLLSENAPLGCLVVGVGNAGGNAGAVLCHRVHHGGS
jgi:heterodisulfide reductase subunit C